MKTIHVDQLGYRPKDAKKAVLLTGDSTFTVCAADGTVVYSGTASEPIPSPASGETVRVADFSEVIQPGEYYICSGKEKSYPFLVNENPYGELRLALLKMLDYQKCGVDLACGAWSHPACHTGLATVYGTDKKMDVSGGWHDAGDYGRYIVPAAKTVADLLLAHEWSTAPDAEILETTWFEIEWMLKMQDPATGGVYHKVSCYSFCGLDVMPEDEKETLVLSPISSTATADFAAVMAMATRFYPGQRKSLLAAATKAWSWCENHLSEPGFRNPPEIRTGGYGDHNDRDEYFWAACELFAATKEEKYHAIIKWSDVYTGLGWNDMGAFGIIAYLLHGGDAIDNAVADKMKARLLNACRMILGRYKSDPYGISLGRDYVWGSSMTVANHAMMLILGSRFVKESKDVPHMGGRFVEYGKDSYIEAAVQHIHYLLGLNALSQSYITGFGPTAPKYPHHRPSVAQNAAVPGMVVGGPDMNLSDPALRKARAGEPPARCYIDDKDSFASNEITIYWNSPLYFVLAALGL